MAKFIKILELKDITPHDLDGCKYRLKYEIGEGDARSFQSEIPGSIEIEVSRTLQTVWGVTDNELQTISGSLAVDNILQDPYGEHTSITLNTFTAHRTPPKRPQFEIGELVPVPAQRAVDASLEERMAQISFLAVDISEIRDQINAISKHVIGERVLELPQERAIIEMYKPVQTSEEFTNRLTSLAGLITAINKDAIKKHRGLQSDDTRGSILLLEDLLTHFSNSNDAKSVCDILKQINYLRQGYPVHGDNVDKVLPAHDFFGLSYPINDYGAAWEIIIRRYFEAMKNMLQIFVAQREAFTSGN